VLQVIAAYQRACGKPIAYQVVARRAGDVAMAYADPSLAEKILGWRAKRSLDEMCASSWKWQSMNPDGYRTGA
jgi:UDP-glucose 4-epimerase